MCQAPTWAWLHNFRAKLCGCKLTLSTPIGWITVTPDEELEHARIFLIETSGQLQIQRLLCEEPFRRTPARRPPAEAHFHARCSTRFCMMSEPAPLCLPYLLTFYSLPHNHPSPQTSRPYTRPLCVNVLRQPIPHNDLHPPQITKDCSPILVSALRAPCGDAPKHHVACARHRRLVGVRSPTLV